jgi:hypothetical protein
MAVTNIDLGAIIPAFAKLVDGIAYCTEASVFSVGATTLVGGIGNATGGTQLSASATIYALNAINGSSAAITAPITPNAAATHVWLTDVTPGANWSTQTAGKYKIVITYIDNASA